MPTLPRPRTVVRRTLDPWVPGLFEYLALRLSDVHAAQRVLRATLAAVATRSWTALSAAPGIKARVYRLARERAEAERPRLRVEGPTLPFRHAGRTKSVLGRGCSTALARLRAALSSEESEALELTAARELSPDQAAFVLDTPLDAFDALHEAAYSKARALLPLAAPALHEPPPNPPVELGRTAKLLVEAYALSASVQTDLDDAWAATEAHQPLPPGTRVGGRYRLMERVGCGAFGDVYRASDDEVRGHVVALKLLREPARSRASRQAAMRELRMNAAVFHPSLVDFKDHGWLDDRLWFVMPWYRGETLEARLSRGALNRSEARRIFEQLAGALCALHAAGIRHQDIKPENVILTQLAGGTEVEPSVLPVLIDLGVAAELREGLLGGTPVYFAPEVAALFAGDEAAAEAGTEADVFGLALCLRNALEPETQEDVSAGAVQTFIRHRALAAPSPPSARRLRDLRGPFERWLHVDPARRPSAAEFGKELAVLTAPAERRGRRLAVLRWLVPTLFLVSAGFCGVLWTLGRHAIARTKEAELANLLAADARADLQVADAQRRELEAGHEALRSRYEETRLSRSQLARKLRRARPRLLKAKRDMERLSREVRDLAAARDAQAAEAESMRASLSSSEERAAQLEARTRALLVELNRTQARLVSAQAELSRVGLSLVASRAARTEAEQRLQEIQAEAARLAQLIGRGGPEVDRPAGRETAQGVAPDKGPVEAPAEGARATRAKGSSEPRRRPGRGADAATADAEERRVAPAAATRPRAAASE